MNDSLNAIRSLLTPGRIQCVDKLNSKKAALDHLAELISGSHANVSQEIVFDSLNTRERLGSTGLGKGVALPHGRIPSLDHPIGAFIRLDTPVEFDAVDGKPVDLLFSLVVPEQSTQEHLTILSQLAELFTEESFRSQLRESDPLDLLSPPLSDTA